MRTTIVIGSVAESTINGESESTITKESTAAETPGRHAVILHLLLDVHLDPLQSWHAQSTRTT